MKRAFAIFAQFLVFLFIDAVGSLFYHPFHIQTSLSGTPLEPRSFLWDGLLLMLAVYLFLFVIAVLRKRIAASAPGSTIALVLAAVAGYLLKLGFITHNW